MISCAWAKAAEVAHRPATVRATVGAVLWKVEVHQFSLVAFWIALLRFWTRPGVARNAPPIFQIREVCGIAAASRRFDRRPAGQPIVIKTGIAARRRRVDGQRTLDQQTLDGHIRFTVSQALH
ncbi:hypothetical protein ACU4GD_18870 [Cupriavidus basilensis]